MSARRTVCASLALALLTVAIVCAGLGGLPGVSSVARLAGPLTAGLGLEQNWSVFAPRPRRAGLRLEAVVTWSDGRRTVWQPPSDGAGVGAYRDYRWRKWAEHASLDPGAARLWRPAALYIARHQPARGRARPVEISLVRHSRQLAAPGQRRSATWESVELYRARLGSASR